MLFEIKSWIDGAILFSGDFPSLKECVETAVDKKTSLDGARLVGASLDRASLVGASLDGASLDGASLVGASLVGASLVGARLETGELFEEYLAVTVPELLGHAPNKVRQSAWDCHSWKNCPMHEAFGAASLDDIPMLFRPRVEQFVRYFDAKLIPPPECLIEDRPAGEE